MKGLIRTISVLVLSTLVFSLAGCKEAYECTDEWACATIDEGTSVTIVVLANDTDADGDPLTVTSLTQPANGTVILNADNTVTYTPNAKFSGGDSFTYTANDVTVDSNTATVSITVGGPTGGVTVTSIYSDTMPAGSSTGVTTIAGSGFVAGAEVTFENSKGSAPTASNVVVVDANTVTATVTARYEMGLYTETGRLNTEATAGEDKHFAIKLVNFGSAAIEDITFSSSKPEGWSIKFNPEKVDSLESGLTQDVDVVINAPKGKTIAGDYVVTINAKSMKVNDSLELRVTVLTPSIWGWVGIIIVLVVIAGLAVIFRQLGRR